MTNADVLSLNALPLRDPPLRARRSERRGMKAWKERRATPRMKIRKKRASAWLLSAITSVSLWH